jgi:hypothetical protein
MRLDSESTNPARIPLKVPGALQGFLLLKQNEEGFYANPPINPLTMLEASAFPA